MTETRPRLNCYDQTSQELADLVERSLLQTQETARPYNLTESPENVLRNYKDRTFDLSLEMEREYFKGELQAGFFVEAGAAGGEEDSHSLYYELEHGWTGLLVEPHVTGITFKQRRATIAPPCLATETRPHYVNFDMKSSAVLDRQHHVTAMAGIVPEKTNSSMTLQCVPLYTLLLAMGNPTVNWFILDIEGAEYQVLQTIPWHLVDIEMISVETDLAGLIMPGSRQEIIDYMKEKGYIHR